MIFLYRVCEKILAIPLSLTATYIMMYTFIWTIREFKGIPDLNSLENRIKIDEKMESKFGNYIQELQKKLTILGLKLESKLL